MEPTLATQNDLAGAAILVTAVGLVGGALLLLHFAPLVWLVCGWLNSGIAYIMSRFERGYNESGAVPPHQEAEDGDEDGQDESPSDAQQRDIMPLLAALRAGKPLSRDAARALLAGYGLRFSNAAWSAAAPAPQPTPQAPQALTPITGRPYDPALYATDGPQLEPQACGDEEPEPPQAPQFEPQAAPQVHRKPAELYHLDDPALRYVAPQA